MKKRTASWPDPKILDSVKSLKWYAKMVADDVQWGSHLSKRLAVGLEFDQYRQYVPGDDLRLLDWKKYARTGKYYLRQSVQENAQSLVMIVDDSKSMDYVESEVSKLDYAKVLTAATMYVLAKQGDKFTYEASGSHQPMRAGMVHWQRNVDSLYALQSSIIKEQRSNTTKGEVIWMTDLYDTIEAIELRIKKYAGSGTPLSIVHIMGKKEESLEFKGNMAFVDLESQQRIVLSPQAYAEKYKTALKKHYYDVSQLCYRYGVQYQKSYMQDDPKDVLRNLLNYHR